MKLSDGELKVLQDVVGNASLSLKYLHSQIVTEIDETILSDIIQLGLKIVNTTEAIYKTRRPLSFRREP